MMNKIATSTKSQDAKYKEKEATALLKTVLELSSDLDNSQTELSAILKYTEKIRAMCDLKPESYEERKGRREAEIAGLKEALAVLEGESVLLQRGSATGKARRLRRHPRA